MASLPCSRAAVHTMPSTSMTETRLSLRRGSPPSAALISRGPSPAPVTKSSSCFAVTSPCLPPASPCSTEPSVLQAQVGRVPTLNARLHEGVIVLLVGRYSRAINCLCNNPASPFD